MNESKDKKPTNNDCEKKCEDMMEKESCCSLTDPNIEEKIEATSKTAEENAIPFERIVKVVCSEENLCWKPEPDLKNVKVSANDKDEEFLRFRLVTVHLKENAEYYALYHLRGKDKYYVKCCGLNKPLELVKASIDFGDISGKEEEMKKSPYCFNLKLDRDHEASELLKPVTEASEQKIGKVVWSKDDYILCTDSAPKRRFWEMKEP